ncbi:MAG: nucleotidyltransferase domain-containing protein [Anaerolineae bacterium]|nr:nucleotidyltransferase domain-containing protein [Anaerolineae bacterium]
MMNELNPHAAWRLKLAVQISHRLRKFEGIQAIVVGGSVARNYADEYSDLEMPLFWPKLPPDTMRKAIAADLHADFLTEYNGPAQEDNLLINNFQVDFWHNTVAEEETVIADVLTRFETDLGSSNFMDTVRVCIPLYGEAIINRWKEKAQHYPPELAVRNIQENLAHLDHGQLALHVKRHHPTLVYGHLSELQKHIFLVLLALNREYFPTFKWMYQALAKMPIKPPDVEQRFRNAFNCPQDESVGDMFRLINETLFLVEQHYPQIDTTAVRKRLSISRAAHHKPADEVNR